VSAVLKVGDTVHDIEEGLNAGVWSAGVIRTSSEVGCTEAELAALSAAEAQTRLASARDKLGNAGAHAVVDSVAEVPELIRQLNEQMQGRS
jgi:phosphonoacetaldehyde hydrolase